MNFCAGWLERELVAMRPRVVLLLGVPATKFFSTRFAGVHAGSLTDVRDRPVECTLGTFQTVAVPALHPTGAKMAKGGPAPAYEGTVKVVRRLLSKRAGG